MAIYVDTNVIPRHGNPDALEFLILRELARESGHELVIPTMVLDEVESQYTRTAESVFDVLRRAYRDARTLANIPLLGDLPVPGDLAREFRRRVVEIATEAPAPDGAAEEALRREAHRLRPAREGKGARDVAIWLSVTTAHEAAGTDGFLFTRNTKDFGEPGNPRVLHPDLSAEVGGRPLTLATSLEHLLELLANGAEAVIGVAFVQAYPDCERAVVRAIHETNLDELLRDLGLEVTGQKRRPFISGPISATILSTHESRGFEVEGRRVGVAGSRWRINLPIGVLERSAGGVAAADGFDVTFDASFQLLVRVDADQVNAEVSGPRNLAAS